MSLSIRILLLAAAFCVVAIPRARAQGRTQAPNWSIDIEGQSAYVFRGQVLVDDWVLQPRIKVTDNNWYFDAWANFDLTDVRGQEQEVTEFRFNVKYSREVSGTPWIFGTGYTYYKFPNLGGPSTEEIFFSLQRRDILLQPKLTVYRDIDESDFTYASLGLEYSFAPPYFSGSRLVVTSTISYGDKEFNEQIFKQLDDGITDWTITAYLPLQSSSWRGYRLVPSASFMRILDDDLLINNNRERDLWWFGVMLQWGF